MGCGNSTPNYKTGNLKQRKSILSDNGAPVNTTVINGVLYIEDQFTYTTDAAKSDLPEGDIGDGKLGITVSLTLESNFKLKLLE